MNYEEFTTKKPLLKSTTIQGGTIATATGVIAVIPYLLQAFGFDWAVPLVDPMWNGLVAIASGLMTIYGRIKATHKV